MCVKARRKTGTGVGLWTEGFFRLDFLVLLWQDKRTSPPAMSGQNILLKQKFIILNGVKNLLTVQSPLCKSKKILHSVQNDK